MKTLKAKTESREVTAHVETIVMKENEKPVDVVPKGENLRGNMVRTAKYRRIVGVVRQEIPKVHFLRTEKQEEALADFRRAYTRASMVVRSDKGW